MLRQQLSLLWLISGPHPTYIRLTLCVCVCVIETIVPNVRIITF